MKIRSALACSIVLMVVGMPLVVVTAVLMPASVAVAQRTLLSLTGEGEGTLTVGTRPSTPVTFVTVTTRSDGQAEITLRLADGNLQRWNGRVMSQRADEVQINLTNAGQADATGIVTARFRGNQLLSLIGNGSIDNQPMSVRFTIGDDTVGRPPTTGTTINLAQAGQGVFGLQGRPNQNINFASVTVQPNNNAELSIRLTDGSLIRFGGTQSVRTAYEIVINLTSSGAADASGTANVQYGMNNSIISLSSNGRLDNQTFFIQFNGQQASAPPQTTPPQANVNVTCTGQMNNGWRYRAETANRRFTQIRWDRTGQQSTVSTLRFERNNFEGQPVYRGAFRAATEVTLVDLSGGNPRSGTQVSVGVEEWGWSRGNCR